MAPLPWRLLRVGRWGYIAFVAALIVLYVQWPFSSDQGTLSWVGDAILRGEMPYRDAWEIRGPFPFFIYAAIEAVLGRNEWGLRVVDVLFVAAGCLAIWRLGDTLAGAVASRISVALYALWYVAFDHHNTAQSDGWNAVLLAVVAAVLLGRAAAPSAVRGLIAGLLISLCVLSKPSYAVMGLMPLLLGLTLVRRNGAPWLVRFWGACAVGVVAPIALCLWWYSAHGALEALIDVHLRWNLARYTDLGGAWLNRVQRVVALLTASKYALATPFAMLGLIALWGRRREAAVVISSWFVASLFTAMQQGHFYAYHWHPFLPPFAVLAGIGFATAFTQWQSTGAPMLARLLPTTAVALAVATAFEPGLHVFRWLQLRAGLITDERYEQIEFGPYGSKSGVFAQVSQYLRAHSQERDPALLWGDVPGVYYLAGRRSATRFGYVSPLLDPIDSDFRQRYRAELMDVMRSRSPSYLVALKDSVCVAEPTVESRRLIGVAEGMMRCLNELPDLRTLADSSYALEHRIGLIEILRLKAPAVRQ